MVVDGTLYAALTPNKWSDFGKASDIYDVSVLLNPDIGLANVLANFSNAKAEGRDTINGQSTIRISGNVSADAVNKIARNSTRRSRCRARCGSRRPVTTSWCRPQLRRARAIRSR